MYLWRRLTREQRASLIDYRRKLRRPRHRPPHFGEGSIHYHLTAACYEHQPHIGHDPDRMTELSAALLEALPTTPAAWCVLPNHYHLLLRADDLKGLIQTHARFHGRTSFQWNSEERTRGRKVFHGTADRGMRSDAHYWATLNYIHHNPVHHGYLKRWTEWPFSSAADYLEEIGKENAKRIWHDYPLEKYGIGWDDPNL